MAPQPRVFRNLRQPLSENLLKPNKRNVIKLSAIDDRLSDVRIDITRYPEFRNGRPTSAIETDEEAWVCKCRIAGIVYNISAPNACGHCGTQRNTVQDYTVPWNLPKKKRLAWVLQRIDTHAQQPTRLNLHLPSTRRQNRKGGHTFAQKSGVFFVILRALGFDWDTAYRTAYQAIKWVTYSKVKNVVKSLTDSGELEQICYEAQQIYEDTTPEAPAAETQNDEEEGEDDAEHEQDDVDDDYNDDEDSEDETQQDSDEDMLEDLNYNLDKDLDTMNQDEAEHPFHAAANQIDKILDADRSLVVPATISAVEQFMKWRSVNLQHLFDAGIKEPYNAEPDTIKVTLFKTLGQQLDQAKHAVALRLLRLLRENDDFLTEIRRAHTSTWPVRKEVGNHRDQDGLDLFRGQPPIGGMNS